MRPGRLPERRAARPDRSTPATSERPLRMHPGRILEKLNATYWFVPSCMVVLAVGLSFLMPWLDSRHDVDPSGAFAWIGQTQTDGARAVLVAVAGSIIGVTGTTFSITIVAVSFASANFGPRLIANFMRDRGNQLTLGTFISTFVYCLLVLRQVHNAAASDGAASYEAFVPHLSVVVALVLALASVGVLIYFIHHVPEMINIDRLVAGIGRQLARDVGALFPDPGAGADEPDPGGSGPDRHGAWDEPAAGLARTPIRAREAGYLQGVDLDRLAELAEAHDLLIRVRHRPGDFVIEGDALLELCTTEAREGERVARAGAEGDGEGDGGGPRAELLDCFETSYQRSAHQDCLFLADQLVEVIGRAMSPGINDPFTAITCLSWLKGALAEFIERDAGGTGAARTGRVMARPIDFERLVGVAFDQTIPYVCDDRNVALHAMTALAEVAVRARRAEQRAALVRRMDALLAASRATLAAEVGADEVAARHAEAVRLASDPEAAGRPRDAPGRFAGLG